MGKIWKAKVLLKVAAVFVVIYWPVSAIVHSRLPYYYPDYHAYSKLLSIVLVTVSAVLVTAYKWRRGTILALQRQKEKEDFEAMLDEMGGDAVQYFVASIDPGSAYLAKKDEVVFWVGRASLGFFKTRTSGYKIPEYGYQYSHLRYRIDQVQNALWGPETTTINRYTSTALETQSRGLLVISSIGVHFVSDGHARNWSWKWSSIMKWELSRSTIWFQPDSGEVPYFLPDKSVVNDKWSKPWVWRHPAIIALAAELARQPELFLPKVEKPEITSAW